MKLVTKKNTVLALQLFTAFGILVGMGAGLLIINELTDVYMLNGILYTMSPEEQFKVLHDTVHEVIDDSLEYSIVAAVALAVSFITGTAAFILTCFIKPSPKQPREEM